MEMKDRIETVVTLCLGEMFKKGEPILDSELEGYFAAQVLKRKIEVFQSDCKVSNYAILVLYALTEGNPGFIQCLFLDIIKKTPKEDRYNIGTMELLASFHTEYPDLSSIEKMYDAQKTPDGNLIDDPEYWKKCFNEVDK